MKLFQLSIMILLILPITSFAASIHGSVYDVSLNKINNLIIEINSEPMQRFISNDGNYKFNINSGNYIIQAKLSPNNTIAEESIVIKTDGDFNLDLFANLEIPEEELLKDIEEDYTSDLVNEEENSPSSLFILIILLLISTLIWFYFKKRNEIKESPEEDISQKILNFIKKENGRTTQKDLRKNFPLSESKISLVISELESKGKIEKIKKGRGNILILKK